MAPIRFLDCHHHLWDLQAFAYPWLQDRRVEAHFGDYSAICRNYKAEDFLADTAGIDLVSSVHVEAGIGAGQALAESRWLAEVAEREANRRNGIW